MGIWEAIGWYYIFSEGYKDILEWLSIFGQILRISSEGIITERLADSKVDLRCVLDKLDVGGLRELGQYPIHRFETITPYYQEDLSP